MRLHRVHTITSVLRPAAERRKRVIRKRLDRLLHRQHAGLLAAALIRGAMLRDEVGQYLLLYLVKRQLGGAVLKVAFAPRTEIGAKPGLLSSMGRNATVT